MRRQFTVVVVMIIACLLVMTKADIAIHAGPIDPENLVANLPSVPLPIAGWVPRGVRSGTLRACPSLDEILDVLMDHSYEIPLCALPGILPGSPAISHFEDIPMLIE